MTHLVVRRIQVYNAVWISGFVKRDRVVSMAEWLKPSTAGLETCGSNPGIVRSYIGSLVKTLHNDVRRFAQMENEQAYHFFCGVNFFSCLGRVKYHLFRLMPQKPEINADYLVR